MSQVIETILRQVDHTRPDHIVPGKDVGATPIGDNSVKLVLFESLGVTKRIVEITYDRGVDMYTVSVLDAKDDWIPVTMAGIFADQLGQMVWGDEAKEFSLTMMRVLEWREDQTMDEALAAHKVIDESH